MDKLIIKGNGPLQGLVRISGAKNAALPCLTATILTADDVHLTNLPPVKDIQTMGSLLTDLGMKVCMDGEEAKINGSQLSNHVATYDLVKTMRASILVLGPLLARAGHARVSLPGGCAIGARPVDLHIKALEQMGAEIVIEHGFVEARASRLKGAEIFFETVTVTGTENILMAATLAEGITVLNNAAKEPEVKDLADMLIKMGARIEGAGTATITIHGVEALHGASHAIIPDRIEAGTYVCAAAITRGHVRIEQVTPRHLRRFLDVLILCGLKMSVGENSIEVFPHEGLVARDIQTQPHPGYPTDMQAQFMTLMTQAEGRSLITENIFENRFMHVSELVRMGADIKVTDRTAAVKGPMPLSGAQVMATDLRASASLVLAGLIADGETHVNRIYHLDRGYTHLEQKLSAIGAQVQRVSEGTSHLE